MTQVDALPATARLGLLLLAAGIGFALVGATVASSLFGFLGAVLLVAPLLVPLVTLLLVLVLLLFEATGGDISWR